MEEPELTLDDALNGEDDSPEATVGTETETAEAEVTAETEAESEAATTAEDPDTVEATQVPLKALTTERDKRKAAERERDELKRRIAEAEREPGTSILDDEAKWAEEQKREREEALVSQRYNMSRGFAVREFGAEKIDQMVDEFKALAEKDPDLVTQVYDADLPYYEMVEIVEKARKVAEVQNVDEFRERVRAEERQRLEKELKDKAEAEARKRASLGPSLASARSAGSGTEDTDPRIERAEEVFPE